MLRPTKKFRSSRTPRRRRLLTETWLSDKVAGHGECVFLIRLMAGDGFRHLDFAYGRFALSRYPSPSLYSLRRNSRRYWLRHCIDRQRRTERWAARRWRGDERVTSRSQIMNTARKYMEYTLWKKDRESSLENSRTRIDRIPSIP